MAKISQETIDTLNSIPIYEIAERMGHMVRRSGSSYRLYCPNPNHGFEKTPDTYIQPRNNIFKCFGGGGCGCKGNNVISYYGWAINGQSEKQDFYKNVIGAAELLGIEIKFIDGTTKASNTPTVYVPNKPVYEVVNAQADDVCDAFYRRLLELCPIYEEDLQEWTNERKYTKSEIKAIGLKSIPKTMEEAAKVMNTLKQEGYSFKRIPGFSQLLKKDGDPNNEDDWFWTMARGQYYIPIRNELNQIIRLRIKTGQSKPKYVWASTEPTIPLEKEHRKMRKGGASSGAPISIAVPPRLLSLWEPGEDLTNYYKPSVAIVTEGEHKSIITAKYTDQLVIGIPGAGNYKDLLPMIKKLGIQKLIVAIDIDALSDKEKETGKNEQVFKHLKDLSKQALQEKELEVCMWIWNPADGKGIDDLILNEKLPVEINLRTNAKYSVKLPIS